MTHLFRWLPGPVQWAWPLYPGAEWLALRLPDWMEWARMQRCHGNWLQRWGRQRRRWHFYRDLSFSISFSFLIPLSFPSFWQIVHYFVLLFLLLRNLPHCLSPLSLHAVPGLLSLQRTLDYMKHICVSCSHVILRQITSFKNINLSVCSKTKENLTSLFVQKQNQYFDFPLLCLEIFKVWCFISLLTTKWRTHALNNSCSPLSHRVETRKCSALVLMLVQ